MKLKIRHNLTDQELSDVLGRVQKSLSTDKKKPIRLPASNPAQAELSEKVVSLYQKIMVERLGKQLKKYLEEVQK